MKKILYIKHISIEGPGMIGEYFSGKGYRSRTIELENGDTFPENLEDIGVVIVLGGPMNVYEEDKYPYLREEDDFIKRILSEEIPFLGICLGAQLLAKACGAEVKRSPVEEIGFYKVDLTDAGIADPVFDGIEKTIDVFQWHEDMFDIPANGTHLVSSNDCANQAFRFGKSAYAFQFHLEVGEMIIADWVREYFDPHDEKACRKGKEILKYCDKVKDSLKCNTEKMCNNFEKLMRLK